MNCLLAKNTEAFLLSYFFLLHSSGTEESEGNDLKAGCFEFHTVGRMPRELGVLFGQDVALPLRFPVLCAAAVLRFFHKASSAVCENGKACLMRKT